MNRKSFSKACEMCKYFGGNLEKAAAGGVSGLGFQKDEFQGCR